MEKDRPAHMKIAFEDIDCSLRRGIGPFWQDVSPSQVGSYSFLVVVADFRCRFGERNQKQKRRNSAALQKKLVQAIALSVNPERIGLLKKS